MALKETYLKLLAIELEDLREDIQVVMRNCEQRRDHHEITNYVFMENMAVLKNEVLEIGSVTQFLSGIDTDDYETLDSMIEDIERRFREKLCSKGCPEGSFRLIQRKLAKVAQYVRSDVEAAP